MKIRSPFLLILAVAVLAGAVVYGAAATPPWSGIDKLQRFMQGGFYVGTTATSSTTNKVTGSYAPALFNWDFPACTGSGWTGVTLCNNHTPGIPVPGARIGDYCGVTSDHGIADGGLPDSAFFDCSVIDTALVVVREHYTAADAGLYDAPDSGYSIRTFSQQ